MPVSDYIRRLRDRVGHDLLLLPSVTGLVFDGQRRVLLVKSVDADAWHFPGGFVEPNERPASALVRELWEETGLVTRPRRLVGVFGGPGYEFTYPNGDRSSYMTAAFECEVVDGRLHAQDGEIVDFTWAERDAIAGLRIAPWALEIVAAAWDSDAPAAFAGPTWAPPASG